MSKPTYVEAFPEFQAPGRGVPFLAIWKNRKTAHIDWHEGSLWDYAKFKEAIDEMAETFRNIVKRHYNQALKEVATGRERPGGMVCS